MKPSGTDGLLPFAEISVSKASGEEKAVIIKSSKNWKSLKGKVVIIEMPGVVMPLEGVLVDITKDGIRLEGIDLPVSGIIIGTLEAKNDA